MKILILSDSFPPFNTGGAERIAHNLFNGLKQKNHQVFVITTVQNKTQEGTNNDGIYRIYTPRYAERWRQYKCLYNPYCVREVKKIIRKIQPDIVHVHNIHYYLSYYSLKIAKKHAKAVFLTAHDALLFHYSKMTEFNYEKNNYKISVWQLIKRFKKRYNPFRNIIIKHYLRYVDKIFAVSNALKNALNQNNIKNIQVIHNGIDVDQWQFNKSDVDKFKNKFNLNNKKIILYGGRLGALKGGQQVVETMQKVCQQIPDAVLLVIGKKDNYALEMLALAEKLNINITITDWILSNELKAAYWSSNLIIVPSMYLDPFPTVNLEAMACHKPVIGTCFGGTSEIVENNKTGYIVNPNNTKLMAEKIIYLLKNPQLAEKFGEAGYNRIKKYFSLNHHVDQTLNWYQDMLDKKEK